jgi:hypothetical protein
MNSFARFNSSSQKITAMVVGLVLFTYLQLNLYFEKNFLLLPVIRIVRNSLVVEFEHALTAGVKPTKLNAFNLQLPLSADNHSINKSTNSQPQSTILCVTLSTFSFIYCESVACK